MIFINETRASELISIELAFEAIYQALLAAGDGSGEVNPVVIGTGFDSGSTFSIKSGKASAGKIVGLKVGSYWPGADHHGLGRHGSTILLLDPETGRMQAIVEASKLNGLRTAAADAVAASRLARKDSTTLAIFGAGHQARHDVIALCNVLPIARILVVAREQSRAALFCEELAPILSETITIIPSDAKSACRAADVIVTVTPSRKPLFDSDWIKPGTHVASMGSDQAGKQELPLGLLTRGRLFCDLPSQSVAIGEFQHIEKEIASGTLLITPIGDVLSGASSGRTSSDDITVFDSSGVALQDLFLARRLLEAHDNSSPITTTK